MQRRFSRYHQKPLSVRNAMRVIVAATGVSVVIGGILIRLAEPQVFSNIWLGMWWALQTVTTVGYGDVVPKSFLGRLVGAVVMLEAIAFVSIITAVITSSFVARAQHELSEGHVMVGPKGSDVPAAPGSQGSPAASEDLAQRLDEIAGRLARIEESLIPHGDGQDPMLR
jgi:voltage-gated potassium channel